MGTTTQSIPKQYKGASSDNVETIQAPSQQAATSIFNKARKNLLDVNRWHLLAGKGSATFQITDEMGNPVDRTVKEGDYIKINLPAPNNGEGDGNDWVIVESVTQQDQNGATMSTIITVHPTESPIGSQKHVAHFFKDSATSSFIVEMEGLKISAAVRGRNETPNTEQTGIWSKIRNFFLAIGAMVGLNKPQWKALVKGIIKK